jgi:hypothetical protein
MEAVGYLLLLTLFVFEVMPNGELLPVAFHEPKLKWKIRQLSNLCIFENSSIYQKVSPA